MGRDSTDDTPHPDAISSTDPNPVLVEPEQQATTADRT